MLAALLVSCGTTHGPQAGSQTHWLRACKQDAECSADQRCLCHVCTATCGGADADCSPWSGASCVLAEERGAIALCGGSPPPATGLCLPRCESNDCPGETVCLAEVCAALPEPTAAVTIDPSTEYQTLVGFGAGVAWPTDEVAHHPDSAALFDAMFGESGFMVLRLFNQYDGADTDLTSSVTIVDAAAERVGRQPTVLLSSSSPPAALKANGAKLCSGNPDTCTLDQAADGTFDYAGFALHWRESLEAYAAAGVAPDYVSIQNDPNWTPPSSDDIEACRFLPTEGTTTVDVNGTDVEVAYPGYDEALDAVVQELAGLPTAPRIAAPETTGVESATEFASELDLTRVDALAHHMYDSEPGVVDRDALQALHDFGQQHGLPIFQTEMQGDGLDTAIMIHDAMSTIGASVYLQNDFVWSAALLSENPAALIALSETGFTLQDPFHAMRHFARDTAPGWVRVAATSDHESVLCTAWSSPDEDALTVVFVNPDPATVVVELAVSAGTPSSSRVTRTTFAGVERSADLGELPSTGVIELPGQSLVTVAVQR